MRGGLQNTAKAQSSMEFLLVTGFALIILTSIMLVAYFNVSTFGEDVTAAQIQKVGNQIIDGANAVYYNGPPSKKTLTLYFPELIKNIEIANQSVVFTVQGSGGPYQYVVYAAGNLNGTLRPFPGIHKVTIEAQDGVVNITDG